MTRKPCPGCGEPGPRDADKVCRSCRDKLIAADAIIAAEAAWMFDKQQAGDTAMTPRMDYAWERPWPKTPGRIAGWSCGREPERIGKLLQRIAVAVSRPGQSHPMHLPRGAWGRASCQGPEPREPAKLGEDWLEYRAFPPGVVDLLIELQAAIADGLGEAAWDGYQAGGNLLGKMHRGELSEGEFARQMAGEGADERYAKAIRQAPDHPLVAGPLPPPPLLPGG